MIRTNLAEAPGAQRACKHVFVTGFSLARREMAAPIGTTRQA
jgi:hypothetical protein